MESQGELESAYELLTISVTNWWFVAPPECRKNTPNFLGLGRERSLVNCNPVNIRAGGSLQRKKVQGFFHPS